MAPHGVEELSLLGLFNRIDDIDRLKELKLFNPRFGGEEEEAVIASEGPVKKAIASELDAAADGLSNAEKTKAKAFLQAALKAVDPSDKHAAARRDKFSQLLKGIENAPPKEESSHAKRAKDALKRAKTAFKDIHEIYEKWEKGKKIFPTNDELKAMQKQHEDLRKCIEATQEHVDEMLALKSSDARPPALPGGPSAARPKAKGGPVRAADPTVRVTPGVARSSGYPAATNVKARIGAFSTPSDAAIRKAELIQEVRADAWPASTYTEEAPRAPKPPKVKMVAEEPDTVVLSYACTCRAVAETLGISVDQARAMAESSSEFRSHVSNATWATVKERSLAIEKEQKEREKQKEQQKKDKALNRVLEKQAHLSVPAGATAPPLPSANRTASSVAKATVKAKAAPKSKAAKQPPKKGFNGLTHTNAFGGMESDSDGDDGFKTVRR